MKRSDKETDTLRLSDLARQYRLALKRRGSTYMFDDFTAHGLRQALGYAEGIDRGLSSELVRVAVAAIAQDQATLDAIIWAICPHIARWSDPNWLEYAPESQRCHHCPQSQTIDGHKIVCPWRCDAEPAARAVLDALTRENDDA